MDIISNMKLDVPFEELINAIRYHIPIKPISAKLNADGVSEDMFHALFKRQVSLSGIHV
jgi:hypothetical protein